MAESLTMNPSFLLSTTSDHALHWQGDTQSLQGLSKGRTALRLTIWKATQGAGQVQLGDIPCMHHVR